MKTLAFMLITAIAAVALFGQSALQPGGLANRSRGFVKPLKFALYFRSVQPATISVEEGDYDIQIDGSVINADIDYELEEEGKALTRVERTPQGKARHLMPVQLKPGKYTLRVKGFADRWKSVIVVTAKK